MSESVLLAGKRGSGKSLAAVWMIAKHLAAGRPVATNLNLYVDKLVPAYCRTPWFRVPDHPKASDLMKLPLGNPGLHWVEGEPDPVMLPGFKENKNGLLCLDEAGTFLNARGWTEADRKDVINWLLQSRKYGWDLLLIAQHLNLVDKQIRESLIETQGTLRRMDKIKVPVLSMFWKYFTGEPLHFPRMHFCVLRYGFGQGAPAADTLFFRGVEFYEGYDTLQRISPVTGCTELQIMPSAWDLKGSKMNKWDLRRQMAAGGLVIGLLLGGAGGYVAHMLKPDSGAPVADTVDASIKVRGVVKDSNGPDLVLLSDGRTAIATSRKADAAGVRYRVGSTWYAAQ